MKLNCTFFFFFSSLQRVGTYLHALKCKRYKDFVCAVKSLLTLFSISNFWQLVEGAERDPSSSHPQILSVFPCVEINQSIHLSLFMPKTCKPASSWFKDEVTAKSQQTRPIILTSGRFSLIIYSLWLWNIGFHNTDMSPNKQFVSGLMCTENKE